MNRSKVTLIILSAVAVLAAGVFIGVRLQLASPSAESAKGSLGGSVRPAAEIAEIRSIPKPKAPPAAPEPVASRPTATRDALASLSEPNASARRDILALEHLFNEVHTVFHELPIGDNFEITAFLRGDNPRQIAYIPENSPHLNEQNEIIDRWGTPFFFHALSRHRIEVRSAGPDRLHWSEDDIVSESLKSQSI